MVGIRRVLKEKLFSSCLGFFITEKDNWRNRNCSYYRSSILRNLHGTWKFNKL